MALDDPPCAEARAKYEEVPVGLTMVFGHYRALNPLILSRYREEELEAKIKDSKIQKPNLHTIYIYFS